jgi:hypothetical protein
MNFIFPLNRRQSRTAANRSCKGFMRDLRRPLLAFLICTSLYSGLISPTVLATGKKPAKPKVVKRTVTSILVTKRATSAATAKNTMPVSIDINGTGFGKTVNPAAVKVILLTNIESGEPSTATVTFVSDTKIFARAELPTGEASSITGSVVLEIGGGSVNTNDYKFDLPVDKLAQPKPRTVEVDIKEIRNPQNPTVHQVLITPKDDSDTFAADPTDPKAMKVQILPSGATNVVIDPVSTSERTLITYTAADGFKAQDVLVTVFDSSASEATQARVRKAAPKQAEKEMKITRVDVLSLQRRDGFGRLKIEGEGFGDSFSRPTQNVDLELLCDPANRSYHVDERDDTRKKDDRVDTSTVCQNFVNLNKAWRQGIQTSLNVVLVPRNADLRVERTLIMYADDRLIDVYFEFSHWQNYSEPFRLESVSVSVTKEEPASTSTATALGPGAAPPTATPPPKYTTQLASFPIGPQKDKNLEYRYTVLDPDDASELFGFGVGKNFYVLQLSVVNNSEKKLVVPLSSIQAEVEWSYDADPQTGPVFDEGPATLSPLKLAAITSYFDTYQKTKGRKAKLFNILDGVSTLAAALVPVFGKGLERGNSILNGGLIPGLHKTWGDLSSQQLQNLTSMSWDSIEEIPAGGSKEKYVFVQRGDQVFKNKKGNEDVEIHKQIKSLQGLEVSGFIVNDSRPASASPQP